MWLQELVLRVPVCIRECIWIAEPCRLLQGELQGSGRFSYYSFTHCVVWAVKMSLLLQFWSLFFHVSLKGELKRLQEVAVRNLTGDSLGMRKAELALKHKGSQMCHPWPLLLAVKWTLQSSREKRVISSASVYPTADIITGIVLVFS